MIKYTCNGYTSIPYGEICKKGIPRLFPENEFFWQLYQIIEPGLLFNSMKYNYTAIDCVLRWYHITKQQEVDWIIQRIRLVIYILEEYRTEKRDK